MQEIVNTPVVNEKENFSFLIKELTSINRPKYTQVCTSRIKTLKSNVVASGAVSIEQTNSSTGKPTSPISKIIIIPKAFLPFRPTINEHRQKAKYGTITEMPDTLLKIADITQAIPIGK